MKKNALVVFSGGMDSTVLLNMIRENVALAITFNYGSKHAQQEQHAAKAICKLLNIPHMIIPLSFVKRYFDSALLQNNKVIPHGHFEDKVMKATVVPFRNGIMLAIACGLAESMKLRKVYISNHAGDHAIYPDCRKQFVKHMRKAMQRGTYANIKLETPFVAFSKRKIALLGKAQHAPLALSYSCYEGKAYHCGKCGTCVERKEALQGFDETIYRDSK